MEAVGIDIAVRPNRYREGRMRFPPLAAQTAAPMPLRGSNGGPPGSLGALPLAQTLGDVADELGGESMRALLR